MKYVVLIPDGAGDYPLKELGGKTPLEAARTPSLDALAQGAEVGLAENIPSGYTPGTDIGCMSIFGYDPARFYTGRGPLEAAQLGVKLGSGELAFRANLITEENGILKDYSAGHVSVAEARKLMEKLNREFKDEPVKFYAGTGTGYRNLMVYLKPGKRAASLKFAPPHDIMGEPIEKHLPSEKEEPLLRRIMLDSRRVLLGHRAANMVWLWGQGKSPRLPTYAERFGKKGAVITAVDIVKGMGIFAGLDILNVPGVTGFFDTNYEGKAKYALDALKIRDLVIIHVESTDEAGHMGDPQLKVKAIQDVDERLLRPLLKGLEKLGDHRVLVVPDHYTCISTRTHSKDPVPFLLYSSRDKVKGPSKFCERTAASGPVRKGHELVELLLMSSPRMRGSESVGPRLRGDDAM